jgi:MFS family permease
MTLTFHILMSPVGAHLQKKHNPRAIVTVGSSIMILGLILQTFVTRWWAFVFLQAVVFPIGNGLVYFPPLICCWEWFPEKKGLVTGLVVGAFAFGTFIFGFITEYLVNPDGLGQELDGHEKYFPLEVAQGVPYMLWVCIIIWGILSVLSILLISKNP